MRIRKDGPFINETFRAGDLVALDGNDFIGCVMDGCDMSYGGGPVPGQFDVVFTGGARLHTPEAFGRSLNFLRLLHRKQPMMVVGIINGIIAADQIEDGAVS